MGALSQVSDLVMGVTPVNFATAANTGAWVNMAEVEGMNVLVVTGIGAAGEDIAFTLEQAKDASGTGAKALTLRYVAYKIGATAIAAASDVWVEVSTINRDNPAASYTNTDSAENEFILLAYVLQQDLDLNNGFKFIRGKVADVGSTSQIGTILYIPSGRFYKGKSLNSLLD